MTDLPVSDKTRSTIKAVVRWAGGRERRAAWISTLQYCVADDVRAKRITIWEAEKLLSEHKAYGLKGKALLESVWKEMSMKNILFVEVVQLSGPNGDRAREKTAYQNYRLHLLKEGEEPGGHTMIAEVSGYDGFHSHVLNHASVKAQASAKADHLAERMDAVLKWQGVDIKRFLVVATKTYLAENEDEARRMFDAEQINIDRKITEI